MHLETTFVFVFFCRMEIFRYYIIKTLQHAAFCYLLPVSALPAWENVRCDLICWMETASKARYIDRATGIKALQDSCQWQFILFFFLCSGINRLQTQRFFLRLNLFFVALMHFQRHLLGNKSASAHRDGKSFAIWCRGESWGLPSLYDGSHTLFNATFDCALT